MLPPLLLQDVITFCWITQALAGHPLPQAGISCVKPRTMGTYCNWMPQISITMKGELWGPNSQTYGPGAASVVEVMQVDPV
jgi:hypothetical protein